MIKASGETSDGSPLLLIGLSHENLTRLVANEPIMFKTAELGLPGMTVVVMAGRTEEEMADLIRGHGIDVRPGQPGQPH